MEVLDLRSQTLAQGTQDRVITISNKSLINKWQFPAGASSGWEGVR